MGWVHNVPPGWVRVKFPQNVLLYSRKFSSAKNFVKSDHQTVCQELIFVKCRLSLVCSSIVQLSLFCSTFIFFIHEHSEEIHEHFWSHTCENFVSDLI